ncbi:MAG TPA: FKBP-type peptidyl-prolyl cis-trans isomerase N-terminal domain-containing protein, partial [Candidatus Sulfotelmatobacter sp.]|nr:FKBP-type peptidyl-prolyl cis-trans isomerase N-terminal domain-containing protein [Candidatus Sulfotelmatobacter sp.]
MQKPLSLVSRLVVGTLLLSYAQAQQSSASQPSKPSSAQSAASAPKITAKKPATTSKAAPALALKTKKEKSSYALGMSIGTGLHRQGIPVDPAIVARGLRDAMGQGKTLMTEDEMRSTLQQLRQEVGKEQAAK